LGVENLFFVFVDDFFTDFGEEYAKMKIKNHF